jgi:hypothetical protein
MEFNCSCCGHFDRECDCLNQPGPLDLCHTRVPYTCDLCGRNYQIAHAPDLKLETEPCTGKECSGMLERVAWPFSRKLWTP